MSVEDDTGIDVFRKSEGRLRFIDLESDSEHAFVDVTVNSMTDLEEWR